jgi:hypothetical protein
MCKKDDEALRLLREVVTNSPGRPEEGKKKNDNISSSSGHGTSKDYTLDRLAREDQAYPYGMEPLPCPTNPASTALKGGSPE